jgi:hypothetical protein
MSKYNHERYILERSQFVFFLQRFSQQDKTKSNVIALCTLCLSFIILDVRQEEKEVSFLSCLLFSFL